MCARRILRPALPCLVALLAAAGCADRRAADASRAAQLQRELPALLQQQADAWNRGDLDGYMALYWRSQELTFSSGGATRRGWDATYQRYKSRYPTRDRMGTLTFSDLEVRPLGERPDAALVLGRWKLDRSPDPIGGNFSLVWQSIPGAGWRIVHDHTSVDANR
jgi:beta-aspartyl-peptidase (threonine type)